MQLLFTPLLRQLQPVYLVEFRKWFDNNARLQWAIYNVDMTYSSISWQTEARLSAAAAGPYRLDEAADARMICTVFRLPVVRPGAERSDWWRKSAAVVGQEWRLPGCARDAVTWSTACRQRRVSVLSARRVLVPYKSITLSCTSGRASALRRCRGPPSTAAGIREIRARCSPPRCRCCQMRASARAARRRCPFVSRHRSVRPDELTFANFDICVASSSGLQCSIWQAL